MTTANESASAPQSGAAKAVQTVEDISNIVGALVPTVAAIGGAVRLILSAVKPSDAQKAQPYAEASAALKTTLSGLASAIDGFEAAKTAAAAELPAAGSTGSASSSVAGMTTHSSGLTPGVSDGG